MNELPVTLSSHRSSRPLRRSVSPVASSSCGGDAVVAVLAREQLAGDAVEAVLAAGHADGLHDRVGGQEAPAEVHDQPFQRVALVGQRLAQDEVLHRVGGDDLAVVALGVGGLEVLAEDLDADLGGEHVVAPVALDDPLERDAQLAVGDPHIRSIRSLAILATSRSAVSTSASGSLRTRSCAAAMIERLSCSPTQMTNGMPKRSL